LRHSVDVHTAAQTFHTTQVALKHPQLVLTTQIIQVIWKLLIVNRVQESLDNAKVSTKQQCIYELKARSEEIYDNSSKDHNVKSTFSGLQRCH